MSELREVVAYLEKTASALAGLGESLSVEAAAAPLREGAWSAAGFFEHLATAERGILMRLKRALNEPPASAEALAAALGKTEIILTRVPAGPVRVESPEAVRPAGRYGEWPKPFEAFLEARAATIAFARETPERAIDAVVMPHPALGPLTGTQWLWFCGAHGERHRLQIERRISEATK
jgi:hypothetical protein